jgi:hypothetical protein
MNKIQRKSNNFQVIGGGPNTSPETLRHKYYCHNCRESNYLVEVYREDISHIVCTNCGVEKPTEEMLGRDANPVSTFFEGKLGTIDNYGSTNNTGIVQNETNKAKDRTPNSMLKKKPTMIEDYISQHGAWELKDSYTVGGEK